ncbi:hypothetical protein M5D96_002980 [Drosophila gunungcola]|uniref:Uncharacterized protein n=1 Tax=Drosophila gunungcola TaxID=103775 RepID=A0A9P9Z106_9MUSC|nr:hypothetical protein M5D96_002980 [Drosophila gunungcola]
MAQQRSLSGQKKRGNSKTPNKFKSLRGRLFECYESEYTGISRLCSESESDSSPTHNRSLVAGMCANWDVGVSAHSPFPSRDKVKCGGVECKYASLL